MTLHDRVTPCFTCGAALMVADTAVEFADATTTTIIASISMARPSKRSFQLKEQLKEARRLKKQQGEDKALQAAIDALGVPAEGDPDRYQLQPDDSTNESSDESSEGECVITDTEDTDTFDSKSIHLAVIPASSELRLIKFPGDVFQQILTEAKTPGSFSGAHLKYIRGPEVTQRTKGRRAKEARHLESQQQTEWWVCISCPMSNSRRETWLSFFYSRWLWRTRSHNGLKDWQEMCLDLCLGHRESAISFEQPQ